MPVLRPSVSPFQRWSAPRISSYTVETGEAPPLAQSPLGRGRQTVGSTYPSSPPSAFAPESSALSAQMPLPESMSTAGAEESGNQCVAQDAKAGPLFAEQSSSAKIAKITTEKLEIEAKFQSRKAPGPTARTRQPSMQTTTIKSGNATPAISVRSSALFTFSKLGRSGGAASTEVAEGKISEGPAASRLTTLLSPASPVNPSQELQPKKNVAAGDASPAPVRFQTPAQHPASPARQVATRQSQLPTAGGVHIGTVEVRIMPAPAALNARPLQARLAPASVLSRSLTSFLGLSQGQ
jgi:hypothetical protein